MMMMMMMGMIIMHEHNMMIFADHNSQVTGEYTKFSEQLGMIIMHALWDYPNPLFIRIHYDGMWIYSQCYYNNGI